MAHINSVVSRARTRSNLGIESLEARRLKADLLYVYKILFKYVDVDSESFFSVTGTDNGTRGHDLKLYTNFAVLM